jgi:Fe2+ or Zn2+ uptake regulation protein
MPNEKIQAILHKAGLKFTSGREALIELLLQAEQPLTQEEISEGLSGKGLNKVTIYRALDSFLQAGLVHRIESGDRVWKFAFCGCGHRGHCHPHFICRSCGKIECLREMNLPGVNESKAGYVIEEQEVYFKGLCPKCN